MRYLRWLAYLVRHSNDDDPSAWMGLMANLLLIGLIIAGIGTANQAINGDRGALLALVLVFVVIPVGLYLTRNMPF